MKKKKFLVGLLSTACAVVASFAFASCGGNGNDNAEKELTQFEKIYAQYVVYAQAEGKTPLPYEEWLVMIKGETGEAGREIAKAEIIDGYLWITYTDSETPVNVGKVTADGAVDDLQGTDGLEYYPLPDGTYAVAKGNTIYLEEIVIPATYKGKAVTVITESAFENSKAISITIPDSVTSIGGRAFYYCSRLTSVVIPDGVTSIGKGAFAYCSSLTSVVIGNGVTSIGKGAFEGCSSLTSVVIGNGVTSIGDFAFASCNKLQYNEKDSLKYLGNEKNPYVYLADTATTNITTATIENGCKIIGSDAFFDCISLTSVVIPDGVTSIGSYAFEDCSSLTSVVIPDGVTSIGDSVFSDCSSLTSVVIPNSVTSISSSAFYDCSSLTSVVIPNSVTSIGSSAFYGCSSLTSVVIPDGVTSIGSYAFSGCSRLTSVVIPDGVTSIGDRAFEYCISLTEIVIPESVRSIGDSAFYNCNRLTSVYYKGTASEWSKISIGSSNAKLTNATVYYYSETKPTTTGNYWHYDENGSIVVWE